MKLITAKYRGKCIACGATFAAGTPIGWNGPRQPYHVSCSGKVPSVSIVTRFNSGAEVYVNRAGRCLDAPCCGCCS